MGIDVYMTWDDQTEEERKEQFTGFSVAHGHVGYLREAYHGKPYATSTLLAETGAWDGDVEVDVSVLEERLDDAIATAIEREMKVYNATRDEAEKSHMVKSLRDFVALARRQQDRLGKPVRIHVSG